MRRFLQKAFKKDKYLVKKSDDELARYVKQKVIIQRREQYEDIMKKQEERRAKGLNAEEKKLLYFKELETLDRRVYDKPFINDNVLEFQYLHDTKNYLPLNQKWRPFFIKPYYAKRTDYSQKPTFIHWVIRILGSLIVVKIGYEIGIWDLTPVNKQLGDSTVVEFYAEEQIFDYLFNKDKTAVFLEFYSPGHWISENFDKAFTIESSKYKDEVVFMRVHCRKNLTFCLNKMWQGRIMPSAEAYFINEKDEIEISDFNIKHRSGPGIEAFLEEQGIVELRLNPQKILERCGNKYLDIL